MKKSLPSIEGSYTVLTALFCSVLVISNMLAAKLFTLPFLDFALPVGLLTYPLTFVITDVLSEVYGPQRTRLVVLLGFYMSLLMLLLVQVAIHLPPDPAWVALDNPWGYVSLEEYQRAYTAVFAPNGYAVLGSMLAYLLAQLLDVQLFHRLRLMTRGRHLWLRNTGSTLLSQIVDTAIVTFVFLHWGMGLGLEVVYPLTLYSYLYKVVFAFVDTPFCYMGVWLIRGSIAKEEEDGPGSG
jgi:uncharacterized integral membrane protein (TIGR00697 family)